MFTEKIKFMIKQGDSITNSRTGQRMIFLQTWAETNGTQLKIECFSPVTSLKEPEHIHPFQENRFRLLAGQLRFNIAGKEEIAHAGDTVSITKNVPHHFWNSGNSEAHYIQEFYPALRIDRLFETFFALARDGRLNQKGIPNIFRSSLIMLKHEKEIRLAKPAWPLQKFVFTLLAPVGRLLGYKGEYK
jgi:quercetin dioxygenase-like cupin family protein